MKKVVVIHGLSWKPPKDILRARFARHLDEGLGNALPTDALEVAYWADLVDRETTDPANDEYTEPGGRFRAMANREVMLSNARAALRRFGTDTFGDVLGRFFERPDTDEEAAISFLSGAALDVVARPLYAALLTEIDRYLSGGAREIVKARLEEQLASAAAGGATCVIAHSMGSMIAADVLASGDHRVDHLITIGSPLGISVLRRQLGLDDADAQERMRNNIGRWVNLYDPLDKIALDRDLADDFPHLEITDLEVQNEFVAKDGERNHHKSYGYLRTRQLGQQVREFLA